MNEIGSLSDLPDEQSLYEYVCRFLDHERLVERVVAVLAALPAEIVRDFQQDPGFHLAVEDYQHGRGTKVWMNVGGAAWNGSRSVVLRRRLAECGAEFAYYVIAHELAHAHLRNGGWGEIGDPEQAADALAAHWGFARPPRWKWGFSW